MVPCHNPSGALVYHAHAGMVDTVLVAGRVVKQNGRLLAVDIGRRKAEAETSVEYLFAAARQSVDTAQAERGGNWAPAPAGT